MKTLTALAASTLISQGAITALWEYDNTTFKVSVTDGGEQVGEVFFFGVDVNIKAYGDDAILLQSSFGFTDVGETTFLKTQIGEFDTPQYSTDGHETIVDFYDEFKVASKAFTANDELNLFFGGKTEADVDIYSFMFRVVDGTDGFAVNQADAQVFYNSRPDEYQFVSASSPREVRFFGAPVPEPESALLVVLAAALTLKRRRGKA